MVTVVDMSQFKCRKRDRSHLKNQKEKPNTPSVGEKVEVWKNDHFEVDEFLLSQEFLNKKHKVYWQF